MPGAIAANAYQGTRAEYLAMYVFSMFGTAAQLPREADYGLDLACTLTEREGQRARPYAYYSVQVKSDDRSWEFANPGDIEWLLTYPAPLLFCTVDKDALQFRVYHMTQRFHAAVRTDDRPERLAVIPRRRADSMTTVSWDTHGNLYLGDPILDFTVTELLDEEKFETARAVLDYWVSNDLRNVVRQQMGMRASSGPSRYDTNKVPPGTGFGTFSITEIPDGAREKADLTAAEHLEWLGEVMLRRNDRVGALLAGLMVRHLLPGKQNPRTLGFDPGDLYEGLRSAPWQIAGLDPARRSTFAGLLDALIDELEDRTK